MVSQWAKRLSARIATWEAENTKGSDLRARAGDACGDNMLCPKTEEQKDRGNVQK